MQAINATGADQILTANPGCMLQLRAGVERYGRGQRVSHVMELLDEAYSVNNPSHARSFHQPHHIARGVI